VGDEPGLVLLHQAVQRGLLGPWRSWCLGAPSSALGTAQGCRPMTCATGTPVGGEPTRSQAVHGVAVALLGAYLWGPSSGGLPLGGDLLSADGASRAGRVAGKLPVASDSR
jgi:hypothetical protein